MDFPAHDGISGNHPPYSVLQYATFTLSVAGSFNLSMINKVGFQYGSSLSDPFLSGTPGSHSLNQVFMVSSHWE